MLNGNPYKRMKITAVASELASLALDSSISSIHKRFRAESNINSNFNILLILEGKRFEAWKLTIESLHQDEKLQKIDDLFAKLANLCSVLDEVNLRAYPTEVVTVEPIESTREGLLSKLWSTVDSICQSLPNILQEKIEERWSRAVCEIQDIEVLNAIRAAPKPERYRAVGVSAAMRYMSRVISDSIRVGGRSRFIDAGCVRLDEVSVAARDASLSTQEAPLVGDNSRTMGYYTGEHGESRVMIEWKLYDEQWQDGPGSELRETMDKLVNLLDPQETPRNGVAKHRILDCVGYFHEPHNFRFGFLYLLKPSSTVERTANSQLYSVNNIIRMTTPDLENTTRPVLGDIFCLAKDLASCLHALHDAGWFHKNISSHHLLVFCPSPEEAYRHISSAVLVGFNDSRPEASRFTLGPKHDFQHYQHPTYQMGVPFRRTFDFFSLGVVLLELGLSYPVSVLRSWHPEVRTEEGFRKKLLKSYVPQLGERMGALYRDAVRFCLDAENVVGFTQEDAEAGRRAQELFSSDVVVPLFRCFA
ncbi:hypothetical protein K432DRAFT_386647 [Lepidopterella palustris CBS 459.81]|uniref:DUF7580 domain-containing protein n=1 Tax=Lepidopterella palustris CBS 459.81 TaxID=1314670 RepID=A0A8E2J9W4_9PEZI|nr:hypothetical protein K432DRAFT_386647 [Lepidopterella palustris CBS 459.81]